jgi:hypothetical protein
MIFLAFHKLAPILLLAASLTASLPKVPHLFEAARSEPDKPKFPLQVAVKQSAESEQAAAEPDKQPPIKNPVAEIAKAETNRSDGRLR